MATRKKSTPQRRPAQKRVPKKRAAGKRKSARVVTRSTPTGHAKTEKTHRVLVVHGNDPKARDAIYNVFRALDLEPVEFSLAKVVLDLDPIAEVNERTAAHRFSDEAWAILEYIAVNPGDIHSEGTLTDRIARDLNMPLAAVQAGLGHLSGSLLVKPSSVPEGVLITERGLGALKKTKRLRRETQ
jgi:hypothetical protein